MFQGMNKGNFRAYGKPIVNIYVNDKKIDDWISFQVDWNGMGDIDDFKKVNDTYGHEIGDQALRKVAALLEESFRSADYIFRVGGDEFAAILHDVTPEHKEIIGRKIDRINHTLQHPPKDFPKYSVSIGAAFSQNGYEDELFGQADAALYHTKKNGRCGYTFDS